jgi:hypothetical protein
MTARTTFWLIWVIALLPVVAAMVMYFGNIGIPEGRTHHGELLANGTQATELGLPEPDADAPKWQIVLTSRPDCTPCQEFAANFENFYTAIGRERTRVRTETLPVSDSEALESGIWIIDPLGNVVLKFDPTINPTLILDDLKKLLKLSKVG